MSLFLLFYEIYLDSQGTLTCILQLYPPLNAFRRLKWGSSELRLPPIEAECVSVGVQPPYEKGVHKMSKETVYMVDDDLITLEICEAALVDFYDVVALNSGARLFQQLEKKIPHLILLDINMPVMDGYEVILQIKNNEKYKHIPVIFLTAQSDNECEYTCLSLGAADYISKPFYPALLRKRVETNIREASQKLELLKFNDRLCKMVEENTKAIIELKGAILKTIVELVESRDVITGVHIDRTQGYLRILTDALVKSGLYSDEVSTWDTELLIQSSQLHDVGKIAIDDYILRKPGKLNYDEWEKIKLHTLHGEAIINNIKRNTSSHDFLEYARILAVSHHEKWDGSGYPHKLKGTDIPLQGRLMAIADVYDSLVSNRSYKKAFTHQNAVEIITSESGTHFDPHLISIFLEVADEFNNVAMLHKQN